MRGFDNDIRKIRKMVFTEVAQIGFEGDDTNLNDKIEAIPYSIVQEAPKYRESIYREREIVSERVRLAMGMSLRPQNRSVHITDGIEASNIDEKYYEPPLMQVIPSACESCIEKGYEVSDMCRGCLAHPCVDVCPVGAITLYDGKSHIDPDKCINCGKCKAVCPYDAIAKKARPCAKACGVNAITSDAQGRAYIDPDKCVSCGMCMVSCPFGAIADKSQIYQLSRAIHEKSQIYAIVAPAFVGQFGSDVTPAMLFEALRAIGFADVFEVAHGADIGALSEAHQYVGMTKTGNPPFLLTSCCPSWASLAKKYFPEVIGSISEELTPMVATARQVKQRFPDSKVVFIGPCAAKKLEAMRKNVRSDVDFVITFEELVAMFDAREITPSSMDDGSELHDATSAGRGYAVSGGVVKAITACIDEFYPGTEVKVHHADGLAECKKALMMAKAGKYDGYLIEGMGCPGGCMAGAGTNISLTQAKKALAQYVSDSELDLPSLDLMELNLN